MAQVVILTFCVSRSRANKKTIDRLKHMLVMTNSDKRFLVRQQATILRSRKRHTDSAQTDKRKTPPQESASPQPSPDEPERIL
ncbi:hypothetical protein WMY93_006637 [Mugilogobius chulae]|uniref:60S ribosomal protein L35 n=1 Tax=Mugilogobius chulae TaxID=88201 RepID=A0AAW0PU13_9GOBI